MALQSSIWASSPCVPSMLSIEDPMNKTTIHAIPSHAEFVKSGQLLGGLADDDLCILAALGCGEAQGGA